MRGKKHHDSATQIREKARAERRSVGCDWKRLPMRILFWPDELDRLLGRRPDYRQLQPILVEREQHRHIPR